MDIYIRYYLIELVFMMIELTYSQKEINFEYLIQIKEGWTDQVIQDAVEFGLKFKKKLVSNVYLFEEIIEETSWTRRHNAATGTIQEAKKYFAGKIKEMELRNYAKIKYHPVQNESFSSPNINFERWILERLASPSIDSCWPYYGMGVQQAWSMGFTGKGVRVAVVDNGVDTEHPDLKKNIDKNVSFSFVGTNSSDTFPQLFNDYWETESITSHGTMVAGLIAGEHGNDHCSAGIAFDSRLSVLKVFRTEDNPVVWMASMFAYSEEAVPEALGFKNDEIDIYSCSFNLHSKFKAYTVDMKMALKDGVKLGRNGKGNIYVFSAGNKAPNVHDCNVDASASSIYTITISSFGVNGSTPSYAIPCASILASTYGEYIKFSGIKKLETTRQRGACGFFTGTSASAALASGMIALALQANSALTWRDIQYIIVITSSLERAADKNRVRRNAFGLQYENFFGYGLMNATAMVEFAQNWKSVPSQLSHSMYNFNNYSISFVTAKTGVYECHQQENCIRYLEQVSVEVNYESNIEHLLEIVVTSPLKTVSFVLTKRTDGEADNQQATSKLSSRIWNFTSVHFWGENPEGRWVVLFIHKTTNKKMIFNLKSMTLRMYGTDKNPYLHINISTTRKSDTNTADHMDTEIEDILKMIFNIYQKDLRNITEDKTLSTLIYLAVVISLLGFTINVVIHYVRRRAPQTIKLNTNITESETLPPTNKLKRRTRNRTQYDV